MVTVGVTAAEAFTARNKLNPNITTTQQRFTLNIREPPTGWTWIDDWRCPAFSAESSQKATLFSGTP
jgi:hypothetical protein